MMYYPDLREAVATALKKNTMHAHQALEDLLIPSLQKISARNDYVLLLKTFYGCFCPVERLIGQQLSPQLLPDINQRRKASFLLEDIAALGYSTEDLAVSSFVPKVTNEVQAWGALYVLEGSTLGGRGITRMLLKQCGDITLGALKFFNGYGNETGPMWVRFQEALNSLEYNENEVGETVQAANATFLNFKKWIEQTIA